MPSPFEQLHLRLSAEREQPTDIWIEEGGPSVDDPLGDKIRFGANYPSRGRVPLGMLDRSRYNSEREWKDALIGAFVKCGIDVNKVAPNAFQPSMDDLRRARMQAFAEAMANSGYLNGFFRGYSRDPFVGGGAFGGGRQADMFRKPKEPTTPEEIERNKAIDKCRDLKRMRDGTTYAGERANAQAAMDRLQAKHGIRDSEI